MDTKFLTLSASALLFLSLTAGGLAAMPLPAAEPKVVITTHILLTGTQYEVGTIVVLPGTIVQWRYVEAPFGAHTVTTGNIGGAASSADCALENSQCGPDKFSHLFDVGPSSLPIHPPVLDGPTFSHQFNTPGTYTYYCKIHDGFGMRGVIEVLAPAA